VLKTFYGGFRNSKLEGAYIEQITHALERFNFALTPYLLAYLAFTEKGIPDLRDPLTALFVPSPELYDLNASPDMYHSPVANMNWENPEEMVLENSTALQHKYPDRALYRTGAGGKGKSCFCICQHCFEAHRVLDRMTEKGVRPGDWEKILRYTRTHTEIRDFIFSGGEPLMFSDAKLEGMLSDLREIKHIEIIRFHTAALIHCPMRFTHELADIFKRYQVTEIGIHVLHERQITEEFERCIGVFDDAGYGSIHKYAHIPFLRGVNDSGDLMLGLNRALLQCGVSQYYVLHSLPWTLGAQKYRTSVWELGNLFASLKRRVSNILLRAEPTIVARGGKMLIPLERGRFWLRLPDVAGIRVWNSDGTYSKLSDYAIGREGDFLCFDGTPKFMYATDAKGNPVIVFKPWWNSEDGEETWEAYLDIQGAWRQRA